MKVLVTGSSGFVGKNLCAELALRNDVEIFRYDVSQRDSELEALVGKCDFVFHLAGVNRPQDVADFKRGNADFTARVLDLLSSRADGVRPPVVLSSSVQAELENAYGESKRRAERLVFEYGRENRTPVYVFRLNNVFGKWCRPNYNSAVATWCHNLARGLPIQVRDPAAELTLVYIDDVVKAFVRCLDGRQDEPGVGGILSVKPTYTRTLGSIVETIRGFVREPDTLEVPDQADDFSRKIYATYLSMLPEDGFSYRLNTHCDDRGSFTEMLRTGCSGQVSVNVSRPGVIKGQHWHRTKHEKFLVVSGRGVIRFRKVCSDDKPLEYFVDGNRLEVVRIPPGYTHNIENLGDSDMVTVMWANESFDPDNPDTERMPV